MQEVITVENMRRSDAHTIAAYVPSRRLMYRAALGVYRAVAWKGRIGILTGSGNNGGDGCALACVLARENIPCTVLRVSDRFSEDGQYYHDLALAEGVEICPFTGHEDLTGYDILVDCLLGTGFAGAVQGAFRTAIESIAAARACVVSVDINSGLNGDTGRAELAVRSDLTVTIGYLKTGLLLGDAPRYIGKLTVADIGIRLLRDEYYLAKDDEVVFPRTGLSLDNGARLLTPGEAESLPLAGMSVPERAMALAAREGKLVRVLGRRSFVTDGYRGYFLEKGELPKVLHVTD